MFELYFIYKNNGRGITAIYGFNRSDIDRISSHSHYINYGKIVWSINPDFVGYKEEVEWINNGYIFEPRELIIRLFK